MSRGTHRKMLLRRESKWIKFNWYPCYIIIEVLLAFAWTYLKGCAIVETHQPFDKKKNQCDRFSRRVNIVIEMSRSARPGIEIFRGPVSGLNMADQFSIGWHQPRISLWSATSSCLPQPDCLVSNCWSGRYHLLRLHVPIHIHQLTTFGETSSKGK